MQTVTPHRNQSTGDDRLPTTLLDPPRLTETSTPILTGSETRAIKKARSAVMSHLLFALCACIYLLPFMRVMLPHTNEGSLIYGAERIIHGEVFARDFFEVMGPGTLYIIALFFKAFGVTFFATRVWLFCASLCTAICVFHLTRKACPEYSVLPCLVLAATSYGMQWPSISHHVDGNAFALLAVVCLAAWQRSRQSGLLILSGVFAGITASIHLPKGILILMAALAWLAVSIKLDRRLISDALKPIAGFTFVAAVVAVYFWRHHALSALIYDTYTWPSTNYSTVNDVPYGLGVFSQYWHHWAVIPGPYHWPYLMASVLTAPFVFVVGLPALVIPLAVKFKRVWAQPLVLLYLFCGSALWVSEIHRKDIYHLVFGSPLLLIVAMWVATELKHKAVQVAVQVLAVTSACLLVFNLLQVMLTHGVDTRVGTVALFKPDPVLNAVASVTKSGDEVFFYPYCPMYYFVTGTVNPTRYSILAYQYNTRSQFDEAIRDLEAHHVRYVVWDRAFQNTTALSVFPQTRPTLPSEQVMEIYLQHKYHQIADAGGLAVMQRND